MMPTPMENVIAYWFLFTIIVIAVGAGLVMGTAVILETRKSSKRKKLRTQYSEEHGEAHEYAEREEVSEGLGLIERGHPDAAGTHR